MQLFDQGGRHTYAVGEVTFVSVVDGIAVGTGLIRWAGFRASPAGR